MKRQAETTTVSIPTSAPSCDDVQNNAAQACLYYTDPSQCSQCQFDRDTQCDGWTESVDNLQSAVDNRQWITDATDLYYLVLSVSTPSLPWLLIIISYHHVYSTDTVNDNNLKHYYELSYRVE